MAVMKVLVTLTTLAFSKNKKRMVKTTTLTQKIGYIRTSINDGPASLMLKCPEPPCGAAFGPDLIGVLTTRGDYERYKHFLLISYVEGHRKIK
ncbi:hypothetical protein C1H46_036527 [Malus baccata]|uniref:Uncharacterized protein n=1 Tax=Malus baccata TaxID=106549 RepID=A0A540KUL0_MALBA|nr:hypothetical protein C1H46_036527 [Malus baccata]